MRARLLLCHEPGAGDAMPSTSVAALARSLLLLRFISADRVLAKQEAVSLHLCDKVGEVLAVLAGSQVAFALAHPLILLPLVFVTPRTPRHARPRLHTHPCRLRRHAALAPIC